MKSSLHSRLSIKWIMPPLMVLPVIVVAASLIALGYYSSRQAINQLADDNMREIHNRIEQHLSMLMEMPPSINALNRRMIETGQLSLTDMDQDRETVFRTIGAFGSVSSVVLGTAQGRAMWVIRYPGEKTYEYAVKAEPQANMEEYTLDGEGRATGPQKGSYAYDPSIRPWYKAAIEANGPTWGDVYIWVRHGKGETLGVPYVEPIRNAGGEIVGVCNTELTLSDISQFLGQLRVGKTGKSFIMEPNGNLIATSVGLSCMSADLTRMAASSAPDPWIAAAATELRGQLGSSKAPAQAQQMQLKVDGTPMRMAVSPFENRRNLHWIIVSLAPDSDFLSAIQANRNRSIVIGLATVLLMVVVSIAAMVWLMRPLLQLVAHIKRIGEGQLKEKLAIASNREMVVLSRAINDMVEGLGDRMRLRHALDVAMDVQQSLLPANTPTITGVEVAAFSKYCEQTGGDYYDYLEVAGVGENALVVALGDVMGHGVAAAMLMATARGMLRSRGRVAGSLGDLLSHVNELLVADTGGTRFMTMLVGVIDADARTMRWSSAGHDPPLIYDKASDSFIDVGVPAGLPLGVMDAQIYEESGATVFSPGQVLVMGTDGLWESRNTDEEEFGLERLKKAIRELSGLSAREIQQGLFDRLKAYCGAKPIEDDVTYVVIKFTNSVAVKEAGNVEGDESSAPIEGTTAGAGAASS